MGINQQVDAMSFGALNLLLKTEKKREGMRRVQFLIIEGGVVSD